jgi:hypothetical protein
VCPSTLDACTTQEFYIFTLQAPAACEHHHEFSIEATHVNDAVFFVGLTSIVRMYGFDWARMFDTRYLRVFDKPIEHMVFEGAIGLLDDEPMVRSALDDIREWCQARASASYQLGS